MGCVEEEVALERSHLLLGVDDGNALLVEVVLLLPVRRADVLMEERIVLLVVLGVIEGPLIGEVIVGYPSRSNPFPSTRIVSMNACIPMFSVIGKGCSETVSTMSLLSADSTSGSSGER